jgi:hypothetical protein
MKERLLAQRRAEAEAAARTSGGKAGSAPPVPAARPAAPGTGAARAQAAAAAARAASTPANATPPAPTTDARIPVPEPRAASSATTRRPVLSAAKEEERSRRKAASSEVMREVEALRKQQDKWITYGWIVAGSLMLIAGVTYFIVKGKHEAKKAEEAARLAAIDAFVAEVKRLDPHKPSDIERIIEMTSDEASFHLWKVPDHNAFDVVTAHVGTARRERERQKQLDELRAGIADLEAICANASGKSADDLAKARRRIGEYEVAGAELDDAFRLRVARARACIEQGYIVKLRDDAKALAAKGPAEAKDALTAMTKAEDEIVRMLDDAIKSRKPQETVQFYQDQLKAIIPESDALVKQVFTDEVIEKTPWTDLLSEGQKQHWQNAAFKGWQIKDGVLQGVGPDLDSKVTAIMSVGDQLRWRDYLFECEYQLVKGEATFHFRLGASVNNNTLSFPVSTTGGVPFKANTPLNISARVLGSYIKVEFGDEEHTPYEEQEMRWTVTRKGGIGVSVPPGSEIKITKMRIKVLR